MVYSILDQHKIDENIEAKQKEIDKLLYQSAIDYENYENENEKLRRENPEMDERARNAFAEKKREIKTRIKNVKREIYDLSLNKPNYIDIERTLWWFHEHGNLQDLDQIEVLRIIQKDLFSKNPDLEELLQQSKESIIIRMIKQNNPKIYALAEEVFSDNNVIVDWFITSKEFLNGETPLSCLNDLDSAQLIETKLGQSLAGVCA